MASKFKVGDKVRWIGMPERWPHGLITVVSDTGNIWNTCPWPLRGKGEDGVEAIFATEELELVSPASTGVLPSDSAERKKIPVGTGVLDYFPAAIAEIAKVSFSGNEQHNPGEPLHWARGKSADHGDTLIRHFLERGTLDVDGMRHSAKMAWRALAILQMELEAEGAPVARGAK